MLSSIIFYIDPSANNRRSFSVYIVVIFDIQLSKRFETITSNDFLLSFDIYKESKEMKIYIYDVIPGEKKVINMKYLSNIKVADIYIICDLHQIFTEIPRKSICKLNKSINSFLIQKNGIITTT